MATNKVKNRRMLVRKNYTKPVAVIPRNTGGYFWNSTSKSKCIKNSDGYLEETFSTELPYSEFKRLYNIISALNTEVFATGWTVQGVTITDNDATTTDHLGGNIVSSMQEQSGTSSVGCRILGNVTGLTNPSLQTMSFYVKKGNQQFGAAQFFAQSMGLRFSIAYDLDGLTITNTWSNVTVVSANQVTYGITDEGNGWRRVWISMNNTGGDAYVTIMTLNSGTPAWDVAGMGSHAGDTTKYMYVTRIQLTYGAGLLPYLKGGDANVGDAGSTYSVRYDELDVDSDTKGIAAVQNSVQPLISVMDFSAANWVKTGLTVTLGTTADLGSVLINNKYPPSKLVQSNNNELHYLTQAYGVGVGGGQCVSCFLHPGNGVQYVALFAYCNQKAYTVSITVDIINGVVMGISNTNNNTGVNYGIEIYANRWVRPWISMYVTNSLTVEMSVAMMPNGTPAASIPNFQGSSANYIWATCGLLERTYSPTALYWATTSGATLAKMTANTAEKDYSSGILLIRFNRQTGLGVAPAITAAEIFLTNTGASLLTKTATANSFNATIDGATTASLAVSDLTKTNYIAAIVWDRLSFAVLLSGDYGASWDMSPITPKLPTAVLYQNASDYFIFGSDTAQNYPIIVNSFKLFPHCQGISLLSGIQWVKRNAYKMTRRLFT